MLQLAFYKEPAKVAVNCKNPSGAWHFIARRKEQENFTKNFQIVGQAAFDNENVKRRAVSPEHKSLLRTCRDTVLPVAELCSFNVQTLKAYETFAVQASKSKHKSHLFPS